MIAECRAERAVSEKNCNRRSARGTYQRPEPRTPDAMKLFTPSASLTQLPDADLVALCGRADKAAFAELAARYYRPVCAFLFKKLGQADLVEDLAQETFLEAFKALLDGRGPVYFSSWLFGIAHHRCGKWFRRKKVGLFPADEPPEIAAVGLVSAQEEAEEQQKQMTALEYGLASLPSKTRQLLHLKHQEGLTCEQIAARLGQPVGTVKSTLSRTYKTLRARLGGDS
jgi:RNA polymerase sigma-70 factor, ECF subfamily